MSGTNESASLPSVEAERLFDCKRSWYLAGFLVLGALMVGCTTTTSTVSLLPNGVPSPMGVSTMSVGGNDLGVSVMLPATWSTAPFETGFQLAMDNPLAPHDFITASITAGAFEPSVDHVLNSQEASLRLMGARIGSTTTGTVDGDPAFRLNYVTSYAAGTDMRKIVANRQVAVTEYDIILTAAKGAHNAYDVVTIVLGAPSTTPDRTLLDWVASTIHVLPPVNGSYP